MKISRIGTLLIVLGMIIMFSSPLIVELWNNYVESKKGLYEYNYLVRAMIIILMGFSSLMSGSAILIWNFFEDKKREGNLKN